MLDETSLYSYTIPFKYNFTHARVLACPNASAKLCPIMSDGTLTSLTYYTRVLHKGLHAPVGCSSGYIHIYYPRIPYVE